MMNTINKSLKYALFLGCTIPARGRNYEISARMVAEKLGIELIDLEEFVCCGFPVKNSDINKAAVMGAYNLALAEKQGLDICTLCSSCTSALTETVYDLAEKKEKIDFANKKLSKVNLEYQGKIKVRHFARILYEKIGEEEICRHFVKNLGSLKIAIHYGCHYLKPSEIYDDFDSVEDPGSLDALVAATGAQVIDYMGKKRCCGGPVLPIDENTSLEVMKQKLDDIKAAGADAICLVCPFCAVMYDGNQKSVESRFDVSYDLPVLYLPQVLGIAMGFERKELGLNLNVVKTKKLLADLYE